MYIICSPHDFITPACTSVLVDVASRFSILDIKIMLNWCGLAPVMAALEFVRSSAININNVWHCTY